MSRPRWRRRSARAISDGRRPTDARGTRGDRSADRHTEGPAALPDLRLGRRRQVDPDRAAALRFQADHGRPAGRSDPRQRPLWHHRRGSRPGAAGRRPGGGAPAGHHHRRRLPLLHHRSAQLHRRRHPRPRAVHPQHGHRRLQCRPGRHPDRCAQGRPDPDAAPLDHLLAARRAPRGAGGEQDRPGGLRPGRLRPHRRRLPRLCRRSELPRDHADPDVGPPRRQCHPALGQDALVQGPDPDRASGDRRCGERHGRKAVPLPRAMGQPAQSRLPRLFRRRCLGNRAPGRSGHRGGVRPPDQGGAHRHL